MRRQAGLHETLPLGTKARHRTTTLTLPGSSLIGDGGAMCAYEMSDARIEGAEAVVCSGYILSSSWSPIKG
jgi:hypothetical protein